MKRVFFIFLLFSLIFLSGCPNQQVAAITLAKAFRTINADTNSISAEKMKDTLTIAGGTGISTKVSNKILEISYIGGREDASFSWLSQTESDFSSGNGYDFNHTKVTPNGNVMPDGQLDYNVHKSYPADFDVNLVAYYTFNGDDSNATHVFDLTSNNNDGEFKGGADINAWGMWDTNAGFFDGVDDVVALGSKISLGNEYSIALWLKTTSSTNFQIITDDAGELYYATGGIILYNHKFTVRETSADSSALLSSTINIDDGSWHHVVYAQLDSTTARLYIDGVLDNSSDAFDAIDQIDNIGWGAGVNEVGFDGTIAQVKVFNRALTATEIEMDYNSWMQSHYYSEIFDANETFSWSWRTIEWDETTDANNTLSVDYRSCNDMHCTGESWITGLQGGGTVHTLLAADNRYFQYKVNFDTNKTSWNAHRTGNTDKGNYARFTNANIVFDRGDLNISIKNEWIDGNWMAKSPDGNWWNCGVTNGGVVQCS